ncbi:hypothetical protein, partial [Zoogloea sp. LCSB751]
PKELAHYARSKADNSNSYPLDGHFSRWYYNGDLNEEGEYKAGLKEGLWVQYASGLKQKEQTFVNGKLNGDYAEYYQGRRRVTGQYEDN